MGFGLTAQAPARAPLPAGEQPKRRSNTEVRAHLLELWNSCNTSGLFQCEECKRVYKSGYKKAHMKTHNSCESSLLSDPAAIAQEVPVPSTQPLQQSLLPDPAAIAQKVPAPSSQLLQPALVVPAHSPSHAAPSSYAILYGLATCKLSNSNQKLANNASRSCASRSSSFCFFRPVLTLHSTDVEDGWLYVAY